MGSYEFLLQDKEFDSVHPSLQRQAILNMAYGLYEVVPGRIYQVRGFDLANISFIKGDTGWIVFDPLTAKETAKAALDFINEKVGKLPVVAVVYSHSHADHYGGVRGVVDEADVTGGKVPVIAPVGFMKYAVSENVYSGNAMNRRMFFQYGVLLPRSPFGHVDQSIGKNTAAGNLGLIPPNRIIQKDIEELTVDGVQMVFQNTPGTEAPAEMNTYFPQFKAFWAAENICGTVHNIYTLRGALVRDALEWSKKVNEALYRFGSEAEVMFASHSWPRFGNNRIQEVMRTQRDIYANLNNEVLHQANKGVTINEIHNVYKPPKSLQQQWAAHSYHGSEEHNSRAVINRYLGYWDANPATLIPLSPRDSAPLYVEMMGGAKKIIAKGKQLFNQGKYREAMEILNKLVYAEPKNRAAKDLLADVFEQIGYQKESPSVRNSFLAAAYELRSGIPSGASPKSAGPDTVRAMSTDLWLDFLAIRLDSKKAEGMKFVINLVTPDNGEKYVVEMSNSSLTNIKGFQAKNPDLSITINRSDLETVMMGKVTMDEQIAAGKAKLVGERKPYDQLKAVLVQFTPDFELMPGTKPDKRVPVPTKDPFEQEEPGNTAGG
jgi:alkyl sulfatase BDS1-like metallo-beta-lactamase superfamily hydrolase